MSDNISALADEALDALIFALRAIDPKAEILNGRWSDSDTVLRGEVGTTVGLMRRSVSFSLDVFELHAPSPKYIQEMAKCILGVLHGPERMIEELEAQRDEARRDANYWETMYDNARQGDTW